MKSRCIAERKKKEAFMSFLDVNCQFYRNWAYKFDLVMSSILTAWHSAIKEYRKIIESEWNWEDKSKTGHEINKIMTYIYACRKLTCSFVESNKNVNICTILYFMYTFHIRSIQDLIKNQRIVSISGEKRIRIK